MCKEHDSTWDAFLTPFGCIGCQLWTVLLNKARVLPSLRSKHANKHYFALLHLTHLPHPVYVCVGPGRAKLSGDISMPPFGWTTDERRAANVEALLKAARAAAERAAKEQAEREAAAEVKPKEGAAKEGAAAAGGDGAAARGHEQGSAPSTVVAAPAGDGAGEDEWMDLGPTGGGGGAEAKAAAAAKAGGDGDAKAKAGEAAVPAAAVDDAGDEKPKASGAAPEEAVLAPAALLVQNDGGGGGAPPPAEVASGAAKAAPAPEAEGGKVEPAGGSAPKPARQLPSMDNPVVKQMNADVRARPPACPPRSILHV